MTIINWEDTLASLEIESLGENRFTARNIPMPYPRIFGGQLLAQCIRVGERCAEGMGTRSVSVNFLREGNLEEPLEFRVESLRDGRTFATRLIRGVQGDEPVFIATLSLHIDEAGLEYQVDAPMVDAPEDAQPMDLSMIPWETRVVGGTDLESRAVGPAQYAFWMRAPEIRTEASLHQALLAHATDLTLIGTSLRPIQGLSEQDSGTKIRTAVSAHSLVFHRALRIDDWLLVSQESPIVAGGRGYGLGRVFSRTGKLVASFHQESLIRPMAP